MEKNDTSKYFWKNFTIFLKNSKLSVNCPLSKASSFENTFS